MQISNKHNLVDTPADAEQRFGIRVTLPASDPFNRLVADNWETYYWFSSAAERDRVIEEKSALHRFSRMGDTPTVNYDPVDR